MHCFISISRPKKSNTWTNLVFLFNLHGSSTLLGILQNEKTTSPSHWNNIDLAWLV